MISRSILGIIGLIFIGTFSLAFAQTLSDNVVINEIDTNPPGDDSKTISEWIELYNPTDSEINIGGWKIASTTGLKKALTIPEGTTIKPNQFKTFSYQSLWFTDVSERVELRDSGGVVIDSTPSITDLKNDFTSWQRTFDGYGADSADDWKFVTSTAGSSNGKLNEIEEKTGGVTVTVDTGKTDFIFDETVTISGKVSKRLFIEKPFFQAEQIEIKIIGPNYFKTLTLFPDLNLSYKTSLNLQKVLGFSEGVYDVSVKYAEASSQAKFALGTKLVAQAETQESSLTVTTDKGFYIPGQTVKLSAKTSKMIPFEGLKFSVTDPNGKKIFGGTLFPNHSGEFSTSFFMTTVSPVFGLHNVVAEYSTLSAQALFELSKDAKEDKIISLTTDKTVYGLGDKVIVSGRLNKVWIPSLDLEILQVGTKATGTDVQDILKILNVARVAGDGTFTYEFTIPNNKNRLGDYKVTVTKEIGTESVIFKVVSDPESFVDTSEPFTIKTDKLIYGIGDEIIISGNIKEQQTGSSKVISPVVNISIKKLDGGQITIPTFKPEGNDPRQIIYSFTAVPSITGNYKVVDKIQPSAYTPGTYEIVGSYADGKLKSKTTFNVVSSTAIGDTSIVANLNKEIFGLGETVTLTGSIAQISQGTGVTIVVTKPDGNADKFGTLLDNGKFSWSYQLPKSEKQSTVTNTRSQTTSNFGIYRITVSIPTQSVDYFIKVSPNPLEDTFESRPLVITTDKTEYTAGEKLTIIGIAQKRSQGQEGLVVPERATVTVLSPQNKVIYESAMFLDLGGKFQTTFDLPLTVFKDGKYKVKSTYLTNRAETFFQVSNSVLKGASGSLELLIDIDKEEYHPGDTVGITIRPTKFIFLEKIDIGIPNEEQTKINCGAFVCGKGVPIVTLRPDPAGNFHYQHKIPSGAGSMGKYVITVDAEAGTFKKEFSVIEKPAIVEQPVETKLSEKKIEKFNRITDSDISVSVSSKVSDGTTLLPRVLEGSLITPERGQEANVNIKLFAPNGTCVIGPNEDCAVTSSTRAPGTIYNLVEIDQVQYKVRYSGPDVRLEKFSILPEDDASYIPDSEWEVQILKDEQVSRFYYKITHNVSE